MRDLIAQAERLKKAIKANENEIDNPVLVSGLLNELDFFIENLE